MKQITNTIRNTILIVLAALAFGISQTSCQQVKSIFSDDASTTEVQDATKLQIVVQAFEVGTMLGVRQVVLNKPETAGVFEKVTIALDVAIADGKLSPEQVETLIGDALVGNEYEYEIKAGIQLALVTYDKFYNLNVTAEGKVLVPEKVKQVLNAIKTGIVTGVASAQGNVTVVQYSGINPLDLLTEDQLTLHRD